MRIGFWSGFAKFFSKDLFYWPPFIESPTDNGDRESSCARPFRNAFGLAVERNKAIRRAVVALLPWGSPTTIFRSVVALGVDPVKAGPFWSFAHVGKKILEVMPAVTNFYPFTAIASVIGSAGTQASALHGIPRHKGWRFGAFSTMTVTCIYVNFVAATGLNGTGTKRDSGYDFASAAITDAVPKRPTFGSLVREALNNESGKALTSKVDMTIHWFTSIMASNHWKVRNSGVIDVPFSAAKPSYAFGV
jgi:hypothetical protein